LIHGEISVYPMGTSTTSASFYIAKGIESIQNMEGIRYEINAMGKAIPTTIGSMDMLFTIFVTVL